MINRRNKIFVAGIKKDKNIIDLSETWHNSSEVPTKESCNILCQTSYKECRIDYIPTCLKGCKLTEESWKEFIDERNIKQWAYINDLLPRRDKDGSN